MESMTYLYLCTKAAPPWKGEVGEARDSHAPTDTAGFDVAARASVP